MKKVTLLCGMLLALVATVASAGPGVNLRWSACFGDGGLANRNSACNTNAGQVNNLVGSFELNAAGLADVSGIEIVVDVATASATLPAWWGVSGVGVCRPGSLVMNPTISPLAVVCQDWAAGGAAGGLAAYPIGLLGPNTARMIGGFAVSAATLSQLVGGTEYFGFNALINNAKTVGLGSCAGCQIPACLILNSIKVATPPVTGQPSRDIKLSGPTNGTDSDYCTWQGGGGVTVGGKVGCPQAVPTHKATWEQVKTLYR